MKKIKKVKDIKNYFVIGNLISDVELKKIKANDKSFMVANFSVASTVEDNSMFVNCSIYENKLITEQNLKKGDFVKLKGDFKITNIISMSDEEMKTYYNLRVKTFKVLKSKEEMKIEKKKTKSKLKTESILDEITIKDKLENYSKKNEFSIDDSMLSYEKK